MDDIQNDKKTDDTISGPENSEAVKVPEENDAEKNETEVPASARSKKGKDKKDSEDEPVSLGAEILSWVNAFVLAIAAALIINTFFLINVTVPSGSMEKTIMTGDRLFGFRLNYLFSDPKRGDIVIFNYPVDEALGKKTKFIKRIIGLPGETLEIRDAKIYINGSETPLEENYLKEEWVIQNDGYIFEIPDGCYLMMGDNRNNSSDARSWARKAIKEFGKAGKEITEEEAWSLSFVKRSAILGKAYLRYWPLNRISIVK